MASKRNEQQTRFELIDPALEARGWLRTGIKVEVTAAQIDIIDGKPVRRPAGRTDYLLRRPFTEGGAPTPVAITGARRDGLPPEHGLQQGKDYRAGELNNIPFGLNSSGHLFVEYDEATGQTTEAKSWSEVPRPEEWICRQFAPRQLPVAAVDLQWLTTGHAKGCDFLRYYQAAAARRKRRFDAGSKHPGITEWRRPVASFSVFDFRRRVVPARWS